MSTAHGSPPAQQRGFILLTSYMLLATAMILSAAIFGRTLGFFQATERHQNKIRAFNFAEAAIDSAIKNLESNPDYLGTSYTPLGNLGGYAMSITAPDEEVRLIDATGYAPSNNSSAKHYENRSVKTYVRIDSTPFEYAAFAETAMSINGSSALVDSYNSDDGSYGGSNQGANGDLATDGTINFSGGPTHRGDVIENPNLNCLPGTSPVASSGSLSLSGNTTHTLAAGTYFFSSISISGNARLNATGPVIIYVSGNVNIGGNGVATSGNVPSNFLIIATGSGSVSIGGNAAFYGGVYAPLSDVNNNASDFYGAIISDNYDHNGSSNLHYDESMADLNAPCYNVEVLAWNEENISLG